MSYSSRDPLEEMIVTGFVWVTKVTLILLALPFVLLYQYFTRPKPPAPIHDLTFDEVVRPGEWWDDVPPQTPAA